MNFVKALFPNSIYDTKRLLLFSSLLVAFFLLLISALRICYPFDAGHYEAGIWAPANLIAQGINPYNLPLSYSAPYVMSPYGVAYYAVVGLGLKLFGMQFWFARFLSFISVIICTVCISKIIWRFTGNRELTILSVFLFLAQFPVQFWIGIQRPDMLALALSLSGITIAFTEKHDANKLPVASVFFQALLIALAILVRQTSILPVALIAGWYFFSKRYSRTLLFLLFLTGILSVISFCLNESSGGGYLWQQYIMPSAVGKSFELGLAHFITFIQTPVTIGILLLCILSWRNQKKSSYDKLDEFANADLLHYKLFFVYFILSFIFSVFTASREGSNMNYYLELSAAISIIVPLYLLRADITSKVNKYYSLIILFLVLSSSFTAMRVCRGAIFHLKATAYLNEVISVVEKNTSEKQPCFSVYPELIVAAHRHYFFNDFVQYDGRAPLQNSIFKRIFQSGQLAAIVTHSPVAPEGYYRYQLSTPEPSNVYTVYVYLPKAAR